MLRLTAKSLIAPKGRNYTFVRRGDNKGRLSVEAVAQELDRPEEYTRALLMPYVISLGNKSRNNVMYPAMYGRTSRPGNDISGYAKAFPLFQGKQDFIKYGKVNNKNMSSQ
eukprot:GILI01035947.1.p1 GENE.GILI01035947.1~~GILI01035947.1.p1  ORF type:complete len:111 (-),score=12.21 GILI01035947.1:79-411(-)